MSKLYEYIDSNEYHAFVRDSEIAYEAVSAVSVALAHGDYAKAAQLAPNAAVACANAAMATKVADKLYANRY